MDNQPRLFGINHTNSNRDFTNPNTWGKNQFNSSFPVSLAIYLDSIGLECLYLKTDNALNIQKDYISTKALYGSVENFNDIFYAFESAYEGYEPLVIGKLPRVDFVSRNRQTAIALQPLEVKLTAIPDNTTCLLPEHLYGAELVVRPDTIVYLACSLANKFSGQRDTLKSLINPSICQIQNWSDGNEIKAYVHSILLNLLQILSVCHPAQAPILMQPIWKTKGKAPVLADYCLDVFVWSDCALAKMVIDVALLEEKSEYKLTRQVRTCIWLFRMLVDFIDNGRINHAQIIDQLSYNTKNDKAFALSGVVTRRYMQCDELIKPRIHKLQIKDIILGGGQNLLSPERRFDAIICSSPELFYPNN